MPKNETLTDQYAICYNDTYLHVILVGAGLTIDTALDVLIITDTLADTWTEISKLGEKESEATAKLTKLEDDRKEIKEAKDSKAIKALKEPK